MSEVQIIAICGFLIVTLGGSLVGVLVWGFNRLVAKIDNFMEALPATELAIRTDISEEITTLRKEIHEGDNTLHYRVSKLDSRMGRIETRCEDMYK